MGTMLCAIAAQHNIAEMIVQPELSQLLHDASPMVGQIWVVKLYSSHGAAAPEDRAWSSKRWMSWGHKVRTQSESTWLVVDLALWKMMDFVSWDDEIPNRWENKNVPNHQPVRYSKLFDSDLAVSPTHDIDQQWVLWLYPLRLAQM